jgi:hypothetical protein
VPVLRINNTKGQDKYKDLYVVDSSSDDDDDDENDQDQVRFRLPVRRPSLGFASPFYLYLYLLCKLICWLRFSLSSCDVSLRSLSLRSFLLWCSVAVVADDDSKSR